MSSKRFAGEVIWGSCALGFNETCFGFCVFAGEESGTERWRKIGPESKKVTSCEPDSMPRLAAGREKKGKEESESETEKRRRREALGRTGQYAQAGPQGRTAGEEEKVKRERAFLMGLLI